MSEIIARPFVQLAARFAAVSGVIQTSFLGVRVFEAPMPWPWLFGLVMQAFVIATFLAATRWAYRPLLVWVMSVVFLFVAFWVGQDLTG